MSTKTKLFAMLIAAVLTLCVTVFGMASCTLPFGPTTEEPPAPDYTERDEMGIYYYSQEDGEVLLTLSIGSKFTLSGPGMNKTGTYTVEGTTLTLDFFKDDDGTATATVDGDALTLVYEGATLNFQKKTKNSRLYFFI